MLVWMFQSVFKIDIWILVLFVENSNSGSNQCTLLPLWNKPGVTRISIDLILITFVGKILQAYYFTFQPTLLRA